MARIRRKHELDKEYPIANYIPNGIVNLKIEPEAGEPASAEGYGEAKDRETRVSAKYRVKRNDGVAGDTPLELHLASEVKLLGLKINGWNFRYERKGELLILRGVPGKFEIETVNLVNVKDNKSGEGLYQVGEDLLLTQNEPEGLRKIFPYFDRPDVMAPFRTTVIGSKEKFPVMLIGGNILERGETNGTHYIVYDMPCLISSYLFAYVAGKLGRLEDTFITMSGRTVNLYIYASEKDVKSGKCDHAMRSLKKAMKFDEEVFGFEYELDIYNIVATPYFNMGAMENKGLNIFNVKYVLVSPETGTDEDFENVEGVIAHEYFHNWTGNRITCKDWPELGTKESITVRRDQMFSEEYCGWGLRKTISRVSLIQNDQFAENAGPQRHAIRPAFIKEPNNMYTRTVYEYGAEVYKMLEEIIGREGFIKGMKLYAKLHDGQATRIEDLIRAIEDANDIDLYQYRNWFTQSGTPTVSIKTLYVPFLKTLFLWARQTCTMAPDRKVMEPFDIPFTIGLVDKNGEVREKMLRINKPMEIFVFTNVSEKPVISLNRNFVPVKVKNRYTNEELARLMTVRDTNLFARWSAGQMYGIKMLLKLTEDVKEGKVLILDETYRKAFDTILHEEGIDKNLLAAMLSLPSEKAIANSSETIDPQAIHKAREFAKCALAKKYRSRFQDLYDKNHTQSDDPLIPNPELVARRSVANMALDYLAEDARSFGDIMRHSFSLSMSDVYTALSLLLKKRNDMDFSRTVTWALTAFYEDFKDDNNTVDKWFAVQASSSLPGTIERVKELTQHPAFDWENPNRVRSLFFSFSLYSLQFHSAEGYRLFSDFLAEYVPMNDIVASRMVEQMTNWKRYTPRLQELMKNELLRLREKLWKVSPEKVKGTMDKIEKSLA